MKKIISYLLIAIFAFSLVACNNDKEYTLTLEGANTVNIGEAITLKATTDMPKAVFVWTSSNEEIAEVEDGTVYGLKEGTVRITVTLDKVGSKFIDVTVVDPVLPPPPPPVYTPSEMKTLLSQVISSYTSSLTGSVSIEAGKEDQTMVSELAYNFTAEKHINSLMYKITGPEAAHVFVKEGFAYMLRNDIKTKSEMTATEETTIINSYGFTKFVSVVAAFYTETEFFSALSNGTRDNNVMTYTLNIANYQGTVFNTEGKDSITLKVYLENEKVVKVETTIVSGTTTNFTILTFKGLTAPVIDYPADLDSYPLE